MAEFDAYTTIAEALEAIAKGGVRSASDPTGTVEYFSLKDLIEAKRVLESQDSEGKSHFGLRMTKIVPPGTGE